MNSLVACIVIAHERRKALAISCVVPSVVAQDFDEIVVVGDWKDDGEFAPEVRYLKGGPFTSTTLDALPKRDIGTIMTRADTLVYLNDDHTLAPHFLTALRDVLNEGWDVLVPNRHCAVSALQCGCGHVFVGNPVAAICPDCTAGVWRKQDYISLNNGEREGYCGGHGGVFKRHVVTHRPWAAQQHTPYWDLVSSHYFIGAGYKVCWSPRSEIAIIDIEPNATPWK